MSVQSTTIEGSVVDTTEIIEPLDEVGLNEATASWLYKHHQKVLEGLRVSLAIAINIGEVLDKLPKKSKKSHSETFESWLKSNKVGFCRATAFRYKKLYKNKDIVAEADGINEAYRILKKTNAKNKKPSGKSTTSSTLTDKNKDLVDDKPATASDFIEFSDDDKNNIIKEINSGDNVVVFIRISKDEVINLLKDSYRKPSEIVIKK